MLTAPVAPVLSRASILVHWKASGSKIALPSTLHTFSRFTWHPSRPWHMTLCSISTPVGAAGSIPISSSPSSAGFNRSPVEDDEARPPTTLSSSLLSPSTLRRLAEPPRRTPLKPKPAAPPVEVGVSLSSAVDVGGEGSPARAKTNPLLNRRAIWINAAPRRPPWDVEQCHKQHTATLLQGGNFQGKFFKQRRNRNRAPLTLYETFEGTHWGRPHDTTQETKRKHAKKHEKTYC
eukprot:GHVT01017230.1.p2 GENE.GHVT01017230.1~~GHVT01017230.1.p2  ORF type:complete len:234 (+),score=29.78 GHVT01017230.1:2003-2704(+)